MRIRPALLFAASLLLHTSGISAMSPLPFFQRVERVGLLCVVDADGGLSADLGAGLGDDALCGRAAAVLSDLLASGPAVTAFAPNDARIADPGTLLLLVHATLRPDDKGQGGRLLALAATLQRTGSVGGAPFFMTPPQALALSGGVEENLLDSMLRRLFHPLAKALGANP
ncbi:hypothetical protein A6A40_24125 (plasmid) [Azospirillum humicireducens]|uniref:Uncharacterized protein n=2 Tax=Azospirillum humicireducens TaxID=1226968 RepID=A0A2R4VUV9_9PROT|nr:hypothetical protein A6A40_24125 [Azospirillum humicireducens]